MEYNIEYINTKYALIKAFMVNARKEILDVSYNYSVDDSKMLIQVVLLENETLPTLIKKAVMDNLPAIDIHFIELYLSKEQFNDITGEWSPKHYSWLENVLFSKAVIL